MATLKVGLTGGIGSGKSTALAAFARCGAATISCDALAHELSRPGGAIHRAAARAFPRCVDGRGALDRRALARLAFSDPAARRRLERLSHPPILREMRRRLAKVRGPVAVVDVPLLFEAGLARAFDVTALVAASPAAAARRVMRRDGLTRAQVAARQRAQWSLERKARLADVTLRNDGRPNALFQQTQEYYRAFALIARSLRRRGESRRPSRRAS